MGYNVAIDGRQEPEKARSQNVCQKSLDLFMSIPGQCIVRSQFI